VKRSQLRVTTQLGFVGEDESPIDVIADMTEPGEVRIELRPTADWTGNELSPISAYLHPTDAAVLGHQLIEGSRAAVEPPPEDEA
jgi:hypothetical protein